MTIQCGREARRASIAGLVPDVCGKLFAATIEQGLLGHWGSELLDLLLGV
jgi:hypothetical protein